MRIGSFLVVSSLSYFFDSAYAWPHMSHGHQKAHHDMIEAHKNLIKRILPNPAAIDPIERTEELLGDLKTQGPTTDVGFTVYNILLSNKSGQSSIGGYVPPGKFGSSACSDDTCCVWHFVSLEFTKMFAGPGGRCNKNARAAIRLGFHDAGTWSKSQAAAGNDFGGADGSLILAGSNERNRPENNGLQEISDKVARLQKRYGVGMADLIQFAAIHATVTCPLGPRIRMFVGRKDSSKPALNNLLPNVFDTADNLVNLFDDKTIQPHRLAALLGAHTTSNQFGVDTSPGIKGAPQDSTPGVWDTLYYNQTMNGAPRNVFRFPSDIKLSQDYRLATEWHRFASADGHFHWNEDYATSYTRLSLLGVNNINNLTDCTVVLPAQKTSFGGFTIPGVLVE